MRSGASDSGGSPEAVVARPAEPAMAPPRGVSPRVKYAMAVAVLCGAVVALAIGMTIALSSRLSPELRAGLREVLAEDGGLLLLFGAFLVAAIAFIVDLFFKAYVYGVGRMAEDTRVILAANPAHRLATDGAAETAQLATLINALAERHQLLQTEVEVRVRDAKAGLEEERHRLAALMSELTEGVLVCNREGLILLYNAAARSLFSRPAEEDGAPVGIIGLGRSVFGVIDRELIAHVLALVRERLRQGEARPVSQFVTTMPGGQLIRAQMAPVVSTATPPGQPVVNGFVLTLDDVTGAIEGSVGRDQLMETLAQDTRAGLASIRAAVEAILEYSPVEPAHRDRFTNIIRDEAVRLSERLDATLASYAGVPHPRWPLQRMRAGDLLLAIRRSIERRKDVTVRAHTPETDSWLAVDSFAVVEGYSYLADRLRQECDVREFALDVAPSGRFVRLELRWDGGHADPVRLAGWDAEPFAGDAQRGRLTLRDVAKRHGGEQWTQGDRGSGTVSYAMLLPVAPHEPATPSATAEPGRPEFYDFDLFSQPGQTSALEGRALGELTYTVFDTETTGLDPSAGDEIISLSAVRIVNGRLLRQESFDQLVDPRRALSRESIAIHGITPGMLQGQPTIHAVLPRFARFAEDTVLVGHNVAFDMRFLQLKEEQTGQRFIQPVLDTLLLSAVVHPNLADHALEANARRFGIPVIGRHTSLGDAIVTAEIFMKLIPLLAAQGIVTLKDAIAASERTYLARIKY